MYNKKPFVIGVCGDSGSGKSTFVQELIQRFNKDEVCWLTMDNYYLPIDVQPRDDFDIENFDTLESFDLGAFIGHITDLLAGHTIEVEEYTFNNHNHESKTHQIPSAPVLLIEGLYIYAIPEIAPLFDVRLFVDVHDHLRLIRRIKRDLTERNYDPADVIHRWEHHVYPAYKKLIRPYRDEADLIINNNISLHKSVDIISEYIKTHI